MNRWLIGFAIPLASRWLAPAPGVAPPPPYPPPVNWLPAAAGNFSPGRSAPVTMIVIHETDGSYSSAIKWFRRPGSNASAHYLVRAWDGEITQLVAESDTAYHARDANPWTIGIEHEFYLRQGILHTDAQYRSSALLVCAIARRYDIPLDRNHIVGHRELPNQFHGDPGPLWDWTYYMSLVRSCAGGEGRATASSIETCAEPGCTPPAAGWGAGPITCRSGEAARAGRGAPPRARSRRAPTRDAPRPPASSSATRARTSRSCSGTSRTSAS